MKKSISVQLKLLSAIATLTFAAMTLHAKNVTGSESLTASETVTDFSLGSSAVLDLAGFDLTMDGTGAFTVSSGAIVKNDAATLSTITLKASTAFTDQFKNVTFQGNLKLVIIGATSTSDGFTGVTNTHTGGTVLDGYTGPEATRYEGTWPRVNTPGAFGTGTLTLRGGSMINAISGAGGEWGVSAVYVEKGDSENYNCIECEATITFPATTPFSVDADATLMLRPKNAWVGIGVYGDATGIKGTLQISGRDNRASVSFYHDSGMPDATLLIGDNFASLKSGNSDYNNAPLFRYASKTNPVGTYVIGEIKTHESLVTHGDGYIAYTGEQGTPTLKVGGKGGSTTFNALIDWHAYNKNWNVEKVGNGMLTLTMTNKYTGVTTLTGGAIALSGVGRIGNGSSVIDFNGGTLSLAADSGDAFANPLVATNAPMKADVAAGAAKTLSGTVNVTNGLAKTGAGMLTVSNLNLVQANDTDGLRVTSEDGGAVSFDGGLGVKGLRLDSGATLDLAGRDLTITTPSQSAEVMGGSVVKNTSQTLSTFTANGAYPNKMFAFDGNLRYVLTGNGNTNFRDSTNKGADGETVVANTHTGGTVFTNMTNKVFSYGIGHDCGTGPLMFAGGGKLMIPSSNLHDNYANIDNAIEVSGSNNRFEIEGYSWGPTFNINSNFSGDGELYVCNGWIPSICFKGANNDGFTGTLYLAYCRSSDRGFYLKDGAIGWRNATVCLTNKLDSTDSKYTRLSFGQDAGSVYFGNLVTDGEGAAAHTDTKLIADHTGVTTLHVGSLGKSGVFEGSFVEQDGKTFAVEKSGAGTWTLCGSNTSAISGGITVNAGAVVLNTTLTGAVTVKSGASFAGTVPSGGVTFEEGAVFNADGGATEITGNVDLSNCVVECANPTDGLVFLRVTGTATGRPQLSDALVAADVGKGRWKVAATTENGVTTFSLQWCKPGLVIIIR